MNPLWDHVLVGAAITLALVYFVRHAVARGRKDGAGCGGGCDCEAAAIPKKNQKALPPGHRD